MVIPVGSAGDRGIVGITDRGIVGITDRGIVGIRDRGIVLDPSARLP